MKASALKWSCEMKEIIPQPPAVVRNDTATIRALFQQNVVPSYGRFDLALSHG